jgi:hypothetical protein
VTTGATGRADIGVDWFKCPAATTSASCPTLMGTVSTAGLNATRVEVRQGAPGQTRPVIASRSRPAMVYGRSRPTRR